MNRAKPKESVETTTGKWERDRSRKPLFLFFLYRLLVASFFLSGIGPDFLGRENPHLFSLTAICYLVLVIASGLPLYHRSMSAQTLAALMVFTDIACITLILHTSGGLNTGLGTLLAVTIAIGGLIIPGSVALLFAAIATLAVLAQQAVTNISIGDSYAGYPQAGLLGASFFAIATLTHVLSQRLSKSERRLSQQELDLANLSQLNEYVIQHMQTGILVIDSQGMIRLMNDAAWHLLGMPNARKGTLSRVSPALAKEMQQWQKSPDSRPPTFRPTAHGRELKPGFSRLGRQGAGGIVIFIEDAASMTQQAQQIKLASLGRLTASIAHEIRNPLGAIGHAGQLLSESTEISAEDRRLLEIIGNNTRRMNEIIENVLQLSRRSTSHPREFRIKPWLEECAREFLHSQQLSTDQLTISIEPPETVAFADPTQLRQIMINLCENAVAHFQRPPQELHIRIQGGITPASGGPYLDLTDNGPGIPADIARQIFEPFFTTATTGTGLGLYIARELSESNRIRLEYLPLADGGSCFRMNIPGARNSGKDDGQP